ncbi:MAG: quinolinate synthase [Candidatus Hydrogenedentota bacterium]
MSQSLLVQDAPSLQETQVRMEAKLRRVVPEVEIRIKAELAYEINRLKRELNAVILGHNYMEPALFHSVPDYTGDSLELSRISATTPADIILFCGVQFMAETAKILNPGKTVLIPSKKAGCSLAAGISADDVKALREAYPGCVVVTYVNTYADVKAEADYCCTSGNASKVVQHLLAKGHKTIVFLPDEFLARNTAHELEIPFTLASRGRMPEPAADTCVIGWNVRCEVHDQFTVGDVHNVRRQFPEVTILAHPECSPEVIDEVDYAGSTKQMIEFINKTEANQLLLLTECSMGDNIMAEYPNKDIVRLCSIRCPHMNQITLEDTLEALRKIQYKIELPEDLIKRARVSIDRMLEIR